MTIKEINDLSVLEDKLFNAQSTIGRWGGRFVTIDQVDYRFNDIVKKFHTLYQNDKNNICISDIKMHIQFLETEANSKLQTKNGFIKLLTFVRSFFDKLNYKKDKVLATIIPPAPKKPMIQPKPKAALPPPILEEPEILALLDKIPAKKTKKTIPERLQNNLARATKAQSDQGALHFQLKETSLKLISRSEANAGIASAQGKRESMEDADLAGAVTFSVGDQEHHAKVYGVFDGHGGAQAAQFIAANLNKFLKLALQKHNPETLTDSGIFHALKGCCIALDQSFCAQGDNSGSTLTMAILLNGTIWVANIGDARTFITDVEKTVQLTEDAKPTIKRFSRHIVKKSGFVFRGRVNAQLATARAIGDKCIPSALGKPKISHYPLFQLNGGHLILACDGLFDVATTNEVGNAIKAMHQENKSSQEMAEALVKSAIANGTRDNVTAIVVPL